MIDEILLSRAADNIEATYLAVGQHGEGARIERWNGGIACTSELHHPVSNFAVVRRSSPEALTELARLGKTRKAFNVYVLPEAVEGGSLAEWERNGFGVVGGLSVMLGEERAPDSSTKLIQARSFEERLATTRFMALQFFSRQTGSLRDKIALATAKAEVDLYYVGSPQKTAAVMVCRSEGMFGVYNLCVAGSHRERGYGSELLVDLLGMAAIEGLTVTLQCDPSLEPWYSRRGLHSVGTVQVLTLERKPNHAIL